MTPPAAGDRVDDERADVLDDLGRVVGTATRAEIRAANLRHRAVAVLVLDRRDRLHVHQRTADKDVWPGAFDVGIGGMVAAGEDVVTAARRELVEELGIRGTRLRHRFDLRHDSALNRCVVSLFSTRWDGPVVPQAAELAWGAWLSLPVVLARVAALAPGDPDRPQPGMVPDGFAGLRLWLDQRRTGWDRCAGG